MRIFDRPINENTKEFWRRFLDVTTWEPYPGDANLDYSDYVELMEPLGLNEIARTGIAAISRGK